LKVAYVLGDDLYEKIGPNLAALGEHLPAHLDSVNSKIKVPQVSTAFRNKLDVPLVSANAYLGARAIVEALRAGADIVICGRVSDSSPVIGAAWYWHSWSDTDYDQLAGAFVSGHLSSARRMPPGQTFLVLPTTSLMVSLSAASQLQKSMRMGPV